MSRSNLRVCASCEWVFTQKDHDDCPKCGFGHYSAHYVYGKQAYKFKATQEPWLKKKLDLYHIKLLLEISNENLSRKPAP